MEEKNNSPEMEAVILAGGFGTRLAPITDTLPKPMVPILGEPVMAHILRLLSRCGVKEATVTLKYMPDVIRDYFKDSYNSVKLRYSLEDTPLGTAGGVKAAEHLIDKDFIVISGDCICDFDLRAAMEFHRSKNADATIVLKRVNDPLEFGIVFTEEDGKIVKFAEKPSWPEVFSDTVNTGIYIFKREILSRIPVGKKSDFSRDIFPAMLRDGLSLYGYEAEGYWCDIGTIPAYYACNMAALRGEVYTEASRIYYRGFEDSIIGDNFKTQADTRISSSVIFDNVSIGAGTRIDGAILCDDVRIGDGVTVMDGCVIGKGAVLCDGTVVEKGTVLKGDTTYTGPETALEFGGMMHIDEDATVDTGRAGADFLVKIGAAMGEACQSIAVLSDGGKVSGLCKEAFSCGALSVGCNVSMLGVGFEAMAAYAGALYAFDLCVFFSADGKQCRLRLTDRHGLAPKKSFYLSFLKNMAVTPALRAYPIGNGREIGGFYEAYIHAVGKCLHGQTDRKICVSSTSPARALGQVLDAAGYTVLGASYMNDYYKDENVLFCEIDESGKNYKICEIGGAGSVCLGKYKVIAAILMLSKAKSVAFPFSYPKVLSELAEKSGKKVYRYLTMPSSELSLDLEARAHHYDSVFVTDPVFALATLIDLLREQKLSLSEVEEKLPKFEIKEDSIALAKENKARVLSMLYREYLPHQEDCGDGIRIRTESGQISILAGDSSRLHVIAEAYSVSAANDDIAELKRKILSLIGISPTTKK